MVLATQIIFSNSNQSILVKIIKKLDECADCLSRSNLYWVVINRGVIICNKCAVVHHTLGRHISIIKCLYYPPSSLPFPHYYWTDTELEMVNYFIHASRQINNFWEGSSNNIVPNTNSIKTSKNFYDVHSNSQINQHVFTKPLINHKLSKKDIKKLDKTLSRSRNLLLPKPRFVGKSTLHKKKVSRTHSASRFKQECSESDDEIYQNSSDSIHRFSIHFKENPLFSGKNEKRCSLDRADFIRAKYQLLAYVLNQDKPDIRNPKEAFNNLNNLLENAVQGPKLEISLMALALGADPNHQNKLKQSMSMLALLAGQKLQYQLLNLWGANDTTFYDVNNAPTLQPNMIQLYKSLHYKVIDYINKCINTYLPNKNYIYSTINGKNFLPNDNNNSPPWYNIRLQRISNLDTSTFTHLLQDLYEELNRREIEMIHDFMSMTSDNTTNSSLPCLPINPDLSSIRNGSRQKLARISDEILIKLLKVALGDYARRDVGYVRHILGSTTKPPIPTHFNGLKERGHPNVSNQEGVNCGSFEEMISHLEAQRSAIHALSIKTTHLEGEAMFNRRQLSTLERSLETTERECKNTNVLLGKILATLELNPLATNISRPPNSRKDAVNNHVYATVNKTSKPEGNGNFQKVEGSEPLRGVGQNGETPCKELLDNTCWNDEGCGRRFESLVGVLTDLMKIVLQGMSVLGESSDDRDAICIHQDGDQESHVSKTVRTCHETMTTLSAAVEEATRVLYPELAKHPGWDSVRLENFKAAWKELIFYTTQLQIALNAVTTPSNVGSAEDSRTLTQPRKKCLDTSAFIDESLNLVKTLKTLSECFNDNAHQQKDSEIST